MSDWLTPRLESAHRRLVDPLVYGESTDCVRAVYAMALDVYGPDIRQWRAELHVADPRRPWSVTDAACMFGGVPVAEPERGAWHIVQGWRRLTAEGHAPPADGRVNGHAFWYWHPADGGVGRVLEANVSRPWDRRVTWGELRGRYPLLRLAWMRGLSGA